ncbi:MAG: hypothetical protein IT444_13335 [Phycisphaeraceae bacterium]|nr:hypothetical protein [Phycisphaeraceae bacterium]
MKESQENDDLNPRIAIRRATDRCFHRVEEIVPNGYIVDGILIPHDEVVQVRPTNADGSPIDEDPARPPVS